MSLMLEALRRLAPSCEAGFPPAPAAAASRAPGDAAVADDLIHHPASRMGSGVLAQAILARLPAGRSTVLGFTALGLLGGYSHRLLPLFDALEALTPGGILVLASDAPAAALAEARRDYRLALVDLGPLVRAAESRALGDCDAVCLLVALGAATQDAAREALRTLRRRGVAALGWVAIE